MESKISQKSLSVKNKFIRSLKQTKQITNLRDMHPHYLPTTEILGILPNKLQDGTYCTYLVMEYIKFMDDKINMDGFLTCGFLTCLLKGGADLDLFDEHINKVAKASYLLIRLAILRDLMEKNKRTNTITDNKIISFALNSARRNIMDPTWKQHLQNINVCQVWDTNRVSKSLGGNPVQSHQEILHFISHLLIPGNALAITRCDHSYLVFVLGDNEILICDSLFNYRFLVTKQGFFYHFWHSEPDNIDDPLMFFDMSDVQIIAWECLPLKRLFGI